MNTKSVAEFLEAIRIAELSRIKGLLEEMVPAGAKILEIGAGTGWQSRALAACGYSVAAIDVPGSNHRHARIWPIVDFDGRIIPFPDDSFDVVYSSNVLEHVEDIEMLNREIARVLRRGGTAIHYVPTSAWRAWSLAAFYPALVRDVCRRIARVLWPAGIGSGGVLGQLAANAMPTLPDLIGSKRSLRKKVVHRIVPHAHGAVGTCLSEMDRFRRQSWDAFFASSGWEIMSYAVNGFFLTGDMLLGSKLPIGRRNRLSRFFGSTAHLYVLRHQHNFYKGRSM